MSIFGRVIRSLKKLFRTEKKRSKKSKKKSKKLTKVSSKKSPKKKVPAKVKKPSPSPKKEIKKPVVKPPKEKEIKGKLVGTVTHYFSRIQVIVIKLNDSLRIGEKIMIKGSSTNFIQTIKSMQMESVDVKAAKKSDLIGLKVEKDARVGDKVFKVS
jgi:hypothetical protein